MLLKNKIYLINQIKIKKILKIKIKFQIKIKNKLLIIKEIRQENLVFKKKILLI